MSAQAGRGGVGSRKHGKSGHGGPDRKRQVLRERRENERLAQEEAERRRRRVIGLEFSSASEAVRSRRRKRT